MRPKFDSWAAAFAAVPVWVAVAMTAAGAIGGCQSILGIEDLSESPRPGSELGTLGGSSGDAGSGGAASSLADSNAVGVGGALGNGGSAEGGMGGLVLSDGGADAPAPGGAITVSGRIIDFFRRPVPEAPVTLGDQSVLTDDSGAFTFTNVTPPYDVSLIAATTQDGFAYAYYAYVYQGLTRPDPTLQVYVGLPQRSSNLDVGLTGVSIEDPNRGVIFSFSSPDASYRNPSFDAQTTTVFPSWTGPATTTGNAHGLLVLRSGLFDGEPPLTYEAYDTAPLVFSEVATSNVSLDMSSDTIPSVNLSGTVDSGTFGSQTNSISLRFNDGAIMPLLDDSSSAAAFSYLVPNLASTSLIVAASAGTSPFVVAHADGIAATDNQNVALTLPRPVAPIAPGGNSDGGPGTTFSWSTLGQTAGVYVWHLESNRFREGIYVITSRSEIEFPRVPNFTMELSGDADPFTFYWVVETHGDYASVDAATGPDGFFDSFSFNRDTAVGPSRGSSGYYSESEARVVNLVAQ